MRKLRTAAGLAMLLLIAGCVLPPMYSSQVKTEPIIRLENNPVATATCTPFLPLPITPTAPTTATPVPTENTGDLATPTPTAWLDQIESPPDQVSILVLGSDRRPETGGFRTDVIQLVILRPDSSSANIVSFPRDLYLYFPGVGPQRINTAFMYGGFDMMRSVFTYNFGVTPDHYVMTNFSGFTQIIEILGGIDVEVEKELTDKCDLPAVPLGTCTVSPGTVHMDGETALWYVRSRYSTSDFDRGRRSQEVIGAIVRRMLSLDVITKAPELYKKMRDSVETDMTAGEILALVPMLPGLAEPDHIRRYTIGPSNGWPYVVPENGAWVFWADLPSIQVILQQAMYFP